MSGLGHINCDNTGINLYNIKKCHIVTSLLYHTQCLCSLVCTRTRQAPACLRAARTQAQTMNHNKQFFTHTTPSALYTGGEEGIQGIQRSTRKDRGTGSSLSHTAPHARFQSAHSTRKTHTPHCNCHTHERGLRTGHRESLYKDKLSMPNKA